MELLDDATVDAAVAGSEWRRQGRELVRVVRRRDFADALAYVNRVGDVAEALDHHPDIDIRWATVTLRVSTHSAGGITRRDLDLVRHIDAVGD